MYHRRSRLRINKKPDHARQIERNMVTAILLYESIRTTKKRARVIQPLVDRLITVAKKKPPYQAIRSLNQVLNDVNASKKVMEVLKERYKSRPSGFTRIVPVGSRKGDGAELVDLTLMDAVIGSSGEKSERTEKTKKTEKKIKKSSTSS